MFFEETKKEIPYKEGIMKGTGAQVGHIVLLDRVSKMVRAELQMCYYPAASPFYVMAVFSRTCVVQVIYMVMATPALFAIAFVGVGVAVECARLRLAGSGSASTKRFVFLIMHKT
jgi:hypothetical protein